MGRTVVWVSVALVVVVLVGTLVIMAPMLSEGMARHAAGGMP